MVGIELPTSGANGSSPFVAANAVFSPREFTTVITTWDDVPWCATDFAPYGDKTIDHLKQTHTTANIANGIGDICRYMGGWRIPTAAEWAELYGSDQIDGGQAVKLGNGWIDGNYYPVSGRAMGAGRSDVSISGNGADARVTSADPNTDGAVFLPASGLRHPLKGLIYQLGAYGCYWTSTASALELSYFIEFSEMNVNPRFNGHTMAYTVRCIRE